MADIAEQNAITNAETQAHNESEASQMLNRAYIGMVEDGFKQLVKSAEAYAARDRLAGSASHNNGLVKVDGWQLYAPFRGNLATTGERARDNLKSNGASSHYFGTPTFFGGNES